MSEYDLTDEQIAFEQKLMEGVMPISIGAFLLPMIWGPAHGIWITILYYPAWIFLDNLVYGAVHMPNFMSISFSVIVCVLMVVISLVFARVSNAQALHRTIALGKTKESYIKSEKVWAIVAIVVAIAVIIIATYYNISIRPFV